MYKQCKTEQSAQRQRLIEEALLEAMQKKHFEDITVSDLCQQLGMPRKSFYRYFGGKDDVLYALVDRRLICFETENRSTCESSLPGIVLNLNWFFEFWLTQKDLLDALEHSGLGGILVHRAIHQSKRAEIFDYAPDSYSREDVEMTTSFTVCGLMSVVLGWHREGYTKPPEEMARTAYKMLSRPLVPGAEL